MLLKSLTPTESLEKTYRLQAGNREQIERFKSHFITLFERINEQESEENIKGHLVTFLNDVYYKESYLIATKGKTDFVIHTGKEANAPAGVLFEVKRPTNKGEMITRENLNTKAMQELILYYFRERTKDKNSDLRYCVITNVYEWFIFDAALFERVFYKNPDLSKDYKAWAAGQKVSKNNDLFYELVKDNLNKLTEEIPFTYFDIRNFKKIVSDSNTANDKALLPLFKILSPTHLLKLPTTTDSNKLNPKFYSELLHLIGLEEIKDGGKKIIRRKEADKRDEGSLLENTIIQLDTAGKLYHLPDRAQYGATTDEQLFSVALELCITWVNRILFLKLLESQLVNYHNQDKTYSFLNRETIADFDELFKLFFQVLAKRPAERRTSIQAKFGRIPYLNSSLFEISELEDATININSLDDSQTLPLFGNSVLKDNAEYKKTKQVPTLSYLFAFLDAYDFASESRETIQEKNRSLINASVLGLIFEKINGYKDGSFYTPGFITEYMCRETIRKAVVQKFNDAKGWHCADFAALEDKDLDRNEANALINEITICDPAVGSGHFLVSALNELIAVKSDLGILQDETGKRLKGYTVSILNDELVVQDEDETPFQYYLQAATGKPAPERQRIQKTLFHEKQTLIENCLFGVDINPNSVKICRLRLWIELLKNAYYTDASGFTELETLPNIDINIKQGNSLLSKFSLTEDLTDVFQKQRFSLRTYKNAVKAYKDENSKEAKAELLRFINDIKTQFRETVSRRDPRRKKLADLRGQRVLLDNNIDIFGKAIKDPKEVAIEQRRLDKYIEQIENEISDIESNALYRGSFEWRFEFPEVLNDKGDFVGFDAVIGNPPYIRQEEIGDFKNYFKNKFQTYSGTADLYVFFVEQGFNVLRPNGHFVYIMPNKWMRAGYGLELRKFFKKERLIEIDDFGDLQVFDDATTYPCIIQAQKATSLDTFNATNLQTLSYENGLGQHVVNYRFEIPISSLSDEGWTLANAQQQNLRKKLSFDVIPLSEYVEGKAFRGVLTGLTEAFVIDEATKNRIIVEDERSTEVIRPFILGRDIKSFGIPEASKFLILFEKGTTNNKRNGQDAELWLKLTYPAIYSFLLPFKEKAKIRTDKGDYWWELRACDYYNEFTKPKIMYQKFQVKPAFIYDEQGLYCNDSMWIITKADKALFALLNSKMGWYLISSYCTAIQNGYQLIFQYFGQIPISNRLSESKEVLTMIVDQILTAKATDSNADTTALEAEIDRLVYALYGLTEEEIAIVEG
ncbi:MAG: Eco57I restriction-modification methylase domain-containing protein [Spirosomataceae bacterium]